VNQRVAHIGRRQLVQPDIAQCLLWIARERIPQRDIGEQFLEELQQGHVLRNGDDPLNPSMRENEGMMIYGAGKCWCNYLRVMRK
jgi:hypothetical protein